MCRRRWSNNDKWKEELRLKTTFCYCQHYCRGHTWDRPRWTDAVSEMYRILPSEAKTNTNPSRVYRRDTSKHHSHPFSRYHHFTYTVTGFSRRASQTFGVWYILYSIPKKQNKTERRIFFLFYCAWTRAFKVAHNNKENIGILYMFINKKKIELEISQLFLDIVQPVIILAMNPPCKPHEAQLSRMTVIMNICLQLRRLTQTADSEVILCKCVVYRVLLTCKRWEPSSLARLSRGLKCAGWAHPSHGPAAAEIVLINTHTTAPRTGF